MVHVLRVAIRMWTVTSHFRMIVGITSFSFYIPQAVQVTWRCVCDCVYVCVCYSQ